MQTLDAIEQGFAARRNRPPDIPGAVDDVLADPSLNGSAAAAATHSLAAAVQAEGAVGPELPYHNRHHVAEAVLAMGLLCALARLEGLIDADLTVLGVAAMVGHDRGHDGSPPAGGRLERVAQDMTMATLAAAGMAPQDCALVGDVILATDPAHVALNAGRVAGCLPPSSRGAGFDLVCQMANEADVFASLLPSRGWDMSAALAAEWRLGGYPRADAATSFSGHLAFLRVYNRFSLPAQKIGLDRAVNRQVAAFAGEASSPEDGAAVLDKLPRAVAHRRYMEALRALREKV